MYARIKELADEAIKLQNKDRMDAVLREISELVGNAGAMDAEQFEAAELAQHRRGKTIEVVAGKQLSGGEMVKALGELGAGSVRAEPVKKAAKK